MKSRLFPKGVRKSLQKKGNLLFKRVSSNVLANDLSNLGIERGDLVCVHSSMSGFGHVPGGAESIIQIICDLVGSSGTIAMPVFTGGNSTYAYALNNPGPFDLKKTGCTTGIIPETFRKMPNVVRSLHPTHSVAAAGPLAETIIQGHEHSITPFGKRTPYAEIVRQEGKVLLLNINANSLMHYVEEKVDWPNNYLEKDFIFPMNSSPEKFVTKVHAPGPFHHVVLPGKRENEFRLLLIPFYALPVMCTQDMEKEISLLAPDCQKTLLNRCRSFKDKGIVKLGPVGFGRGALLKAGEFSQIIARDMILHLKENGKMYEKKVLYKIQAENTRA